MPSSELARANSILQPFPFLPCRQKQMHPFRSGPWASPYIHSGGGGSTIILLPPTPTLGSKPLAWPAWHGLWLKINGDGGGEQQGSER